MSEDKQDKTYEFESAEEVPDYLEGYIDKNLIKKEENYKKKRPLIVRFFGALLNIFTLGFYNRAKRKYKIDENLENVNELGLKDELDNISSVITKEEADAAQKTTDFEQSSKSDKSTNVKETETNSEVEQKEM